MKLKIVGKNILVTDSLQTTVEDKTSKLERFLEKNISVRVALRVEKIRHIAEITITLPKNNTVRVEESSEDMYESINKAVDIAARQLKKYKAKLKENTHKTIRTFEEDEIEEEDKIVKRKMFTLKPMYIDEAILEMDMLGHNFFVFLDADTEEVSVIYKRKDEKIGLIETVY
jgi:putative sigma-54 modulation protein